MDENNIIPKHIIPNWKPTLKAITRTADLCYGFASLLRWHCDSKKTYFWAHISKNVIRKMKKNVE